MDKNYNAMEKDYQEALKYLYSQLPMFSRVGAAAYKPGLQRTCDLDELYAHPHKQFKSIHIAGTNGKGSTSHIIASILQAHGYKTALYTSPHLVDFRERIKINGKMIPKEWVVKFVRDWIKHSSSKQINPSFFELTMMMAFKWFSQEKVDFSIIEVGMGGRLDSTNIINPIACAITNISFDHTQFLGSTLSEIANEKAGIIKTGIPVIISESQLETDAVFLHKAKLEEAPIVFAEERQELKKFKESNKWGWDCESFTFGKFHLPLAGAYQKRNINGVLNLVKTLISAGIPLKKELICKGIESVVDSTGLRGRWMMISSKPLTICDTGHNEAGINEITIQLKRMMEHKDSLRMVIGFVSDKDVDHILPLLPKDAQYYITQPSIPRAMDCDVLYDKICNGGLNAVGKWRSVKEAAAQASANAADNDIVFIGGSTFVVADYLAYFDSLK